MKLLFIVQQSNAIDSDRNRFADTLGLQRLGYILCTIVRHLEILDSIFLWLIICFHAWHLRRIDSVVLCHAGPKVVEFIINHAEVSLVFVQKDLVSEFTEL